MAKHTIDGPRGWTNQYERHNASYVEQIAFVSGWPELCSPVLNANQLDRAEAVWQMDCENRNRRQNGGWNTHQRNERANQESKATYDLSGDCDPTHKVRQRNTRRLKNPANASGPLDHFARPCARNPKATINRSGIAAWGASFVRTSRQADTIATRVDIVSFSCATTPRSMRT